MSSPARRKLARAAPFRALPLASLAALVVAALGLRLGRAPAPKPVGAGSDRAPASPAIGPADAMAPPPAGPSPPPKADVPTGAPRMLHGGPRRNHRSEARGPREPKVGFRVSLDVAPRERDAAPAPAPAPAGIAAQVVASSDESTLYVATLDGRLVALARSDGSTRWTAALGDRVYATPLVHDDGTIYVGSDAKRLFALAPNGDVRFRLEVDGEADSGGAFARDGSVVFAAGRFVHAVRRGGDLAWRFAAREKVFTAPAITDDGLVVFGSQDHRVYALTSAGTLAWSTDLGVDVDGAPAIGDDGAIYVGTDGGEIVRLSADGGVVWRAPVSGFVRGTLSIARNGDVVTGTYGPVPRLVRVRPDGSLAGAFAIAGTGAREFGIHGGALEDADGALYFGAQDDAVYALAPDGALRWRFSTRGDVDAPLTLLSDGSLVVASEDGTVTLLVP